MPTNYEEKAFLWVVENGEKRLIGEVDICEITPHESTYFATRDKDGRECIKEVSIRESVDYTFHLKK